MTAVVLLDESGSMTSEINEMSNVWLQTWRQLMHAQRILVEIISFRYATENTICSPVYTRINEWLSNSVQAPISARPIIILQITDGDNAWLDGPACKRLLAKTLQLCHLFVLIEINRNNRQSMLSSQLLHFDHPAFQTHIIHNEKEISESTDKVCKLVMRLI